MSFFTFPRHLFIVAWYDLRWIPAISASAAISGCSVAKFFMPITSFAITQTYLLRVLPINPPRCFASDQVILASSFSCMDIWLWRTSRFTESWIWKFRHPWRIFFWWRRINSLMIFLSIFANHFSNCLLFSYPFRNNKRSFRYSMNSFWCLSLQSFCIAFFRSFVLFLPSPNRKKFGSFLNTDSCHPINSISSSWLSWLSSSISKKLISSSMDSEGDINNLIALSEKPWEEISHPSLISFHLI